MPQYYDSRGTAGTPVTPQTQGLAPAISLTNVSAVTNGTALDGLSVRANAVLTVTTGVGVSAGTVVAQGSQDNVNWAAISGLTVSTTAASTTTTVVATSSYYRYVRAAVTVAITGGTISASVGVSG
jgi:hypothetical protein